MRAMPKCDLRVPTLSLRAQRGNLVAVATVVCRRVFNLNEIATWFDRLTMSGCAPRNDSRPIWFDKVGTRERALKLTVGGVVGV